MHGHRQERDQTRGGQWDWASVSFQVDIFIVLCSSSHSGISLSVSYQVGLVACATVNYMLSLEFASFLPNSWKLHGTGSNFEF